MGAQFFARRRRVIRYDETETAPSAEPFRHHEDLRGLLRGQKPAEFNAIVAEFLSF